MRTVPVFLLVVLQAVVSGASMSVEIVAGRMLAPYVGMSLYTWTAIIAVVLAGFSVGHWWGGHLAGRGGARALAASGWTLVGAALTTGAAVWLLSFSAGPVLSLLTHPVLGITGLCLVVFFLPSVFAGVPAPVLAQIAVDTASDSGRALGAMFAAGAVGAILGTLLAGFVFISWLGSSLTLALLTGVYALCALGLLWIAGRALGVALAASGLALLLAGAAVARPSPCTEESQYFCIRTVDIAADPERPVNLMVLDHLAHGISARDLPRVMFNDHTAMLDALARLRMGDGAFSSYFIGGGSYSIPRAWADRGLGPITVAEIDPEVTRIAARDFWFDPATATVLHEDARRALSRGDNRFDVIVGDAFTDIAVPAHLVTREFFAVVRDRLNPGGVYLMNVIDFEDELEALASLHATLETVFPAVEVWTRATAPAPGARMVFVIVAGETLSPVGRVTTPAPARTAFAALSDAFLDTLRSRGPVILTDDYAPIDRLVGTDRSYAD